jgi:hypothetical protein
MSLFNGIKWPYATMQQLNLDWILTEIKRVLGFFPESGNPGTVLMKTEDGTAWEELEAVDININGVPEDTELTDTDKLIFYDVSSSANRKITAPNLLNSMMSNGTPLMDGTGSAGTSKKPARYDHRHPTDTSRAPADYFQNGALKIEHGGTGATTAAGAIENLGIERVTDLDITATAGDGVIVRSCRFHRRGEIVFGYILFDATSALAHNAVIATLNSNLPALRDPFATSSARTGSNEFGMVKMDRDNPGKIFALGTIPAGQYYYASFIYGA